MGELKKTWDDHEVVYRDDIYRVVKSAGYVQLYTLGNDSFGNAHFTRSDQFPVNSDMGQFMLHLVERLNAHLSHVRPKGWCDV